MVVCVQAGAHVSEEGAGRFIRTLLSEMPGTEQRTSEQRRERTTDQPEGERNGATAQTKPGIVLWRDAERVSECCYAVCVVNNPHFILSVESSVSFNGGDPAHALICHRSEVRGGHHRQQQGEIRV